MLAYAGLIRSLAIYYGHPLRHRRLKALYRPFVREGDLVFDAGAHVGNHTAVFRALGARVLAVEPQPIFAKFLENLFRRDPETTVVRAALGGAPGRAQLQISSLHPTVSTLDPAWQANRAKEPGFRRTRWDRTEEVDVTTLDALVEEYGRPALVKIDAEGAESAVLAGLSRPVRTTIFEVLPGTVDSGTACLNRLSWLGCSRFNWTVAEQAELQPGWYSAEEVLQMLSGLPAGARERNIIAVHDDV